MSKTTHPVVTLRLARVLHAQRGNLDVLAAKILLGEDGQDGGEASALQRQLDCKRLRDACKAVSEGRIYCPACGDEGGENGHDDNGEAGDRLSWCCRKCGEHFDAVAP